ncbi:MAG: GGDEF domain-containing protein [Fibrobacter sp.]|nr:GGDEF domain-containing protein [Fibrobacter sp.]
MTSIRRKVGFLTLAFMLAVAFFIGLTALVNYNPAGRSVVLDSLWVVDYHGQKFTPKSLDRFRPVTGSVHYGDSLYFETKMPSNLSGYSALHIRLYASAMDVYLDSEKVYSYGRDLIETGEVVGSGYHRVEISPGWEGKTLKLRVYAAESGAFNTMPETTLLPNKMLGVPYSALHCSPAFCLAVFMCLFGAMAMIGGIGAMGYATYFFRLPLIGFFSFVLGLWTVCYTHEIQLISADLEINAILEYSMLFLSPLAIEILFVVLRRKKIFGWRWYGLIALPIFNGLFFIVTAFLQICHIANYTHFLAPFHVYIVVAILFMMVPGVVFSKREGLPERISGIGFIIFCLSCLVELVRYMLNQITPGMDPRANPIVPWGVLVYLMSLLVSYAMYLQRAIINKTEKDLLSSLAYRDALTGLYNRAKCEQIFDALNGVSSDYSITSIDMNGLKKVNDTYGHGRGDEVLKAFARALSEAFKGIGTPIRMGGDEFLVVIRQEHLNDRALAVEKMKQLLKEESKALAIQFSASYGTALRSEVNSDADEVYRQADERMYKMKSASRDARKD